MVKRNAGGPAGSAAPLKRQLPGRRIDSVPGWDVRQASGTIWIDYFDVVILSVSFSGLRRDSDSSS